MTPPDQPPADRPQQIPGLHELDELDEFYYEVAPREVRLQHLLPHQVAAAMEAASIAYLPLGSIEYHSHHLPLGLDGLTAEGVCQRAALRTGGVVLPTLWWGTGGTHTRYPWTVMAESAAPITELIEATLLRLADLQVRLCVLFTGHFADEQLALVDDVAAYWNARGTNLVVLPLSVNRTDAPLDPDHAGTFETMLLHALHLDLVQLDRLPALDQTPIDPPGADGGYDHRHTPSHPLWGVMGPDPRPADLRQSAALLRQVVDWTCRQVYRLDPYDPPGTPAPGSVPDGRSA